MAAELIPYYVLEGALRSAEDEPERLAACVWLSRVFRPETLQLAVETCDREERRLIEENLIRRLFQVKHALDLFNTKPLDQFAEVLEEMDLLLEVRRMTSRVREAEAVAAIPDLVEEEDETLEDSVDELRTYLEPTYDMLLKAFGGATKKSSRIRRLNSWLWESNGTLDELSRSPSTEDARKLGWVGDYRCVNLLLTTLERRVRTAGGLNFAEASRLLGEHYLYLLRWLHPEHFEPVDFVLEHMRLDDDYRLPSRCDYLVDDTG